MDFFFSIEKSVEDYTQDSLPLFLLLIFKVNHENSTHIQWLKPLPSKTQQ